MMSLAELRARVAQSPPKSATSDRNCPTEGLGSAGTSNRICAMALSLAGSVSLLQHEEPNQAVSACRTSEMTSSYGKRRAMGSCEKPGPRKVLSHEGKGKGNSMADGKGEDERWSDSDQGIGTGISKGKGQ